MSVSDRVSDLLTNKVTLKRESVDRMYLNAYVGGLQIPEGAVRFFRTQRGVCVCLVGVDGSNDQGFVAAIERFASAGQIPMITFGKGERKDDIAGAARKAFEGQEAGLFIGKAQEKAKVFRTERRTDPNGEQVSVDRDRHGLRESVLLLHLRS